jgi:hypothetical protein
MGKARCFIALSSCYFSRAQEGRGALIAGCGTCINGVQAAEFWLQIRECRPLPEIK